MYCVLITTLPDHATSNAFRMGELVTIHLTFKFVPIYTRPTTNGMLHFFQGRESCKAEDSAGVRPQGK